MKKINILIVDDFPSSREIICRGIRKFNEQATDVTLTIFAETDSAEEGIAIIQKATEPINLVFLDYNLSGKNGFFLSKQFPDMTYLIVSSEPGINQLIAEEKQNYQYAYMEHVSEGHIFNSKRIIAAIEKYLVA